MKLKALISIITLVPVTGTALLLFSSIPDFERLIDYHVFRKTANRLNEAGIISDENFQRSFLTALETRRTLETMTFSDKKNLFSWVQKKKSPDLWFYVITKKL